MITPEQAIAVGMISTFVCLWIAFIWGVNRTVGLPGI